MMFFGHLGAQNLRPTNNCTSQLDLSNELLCTPNKNCMSRLHPWEVDVSLAFSRPIILLSLHLLGLGFWMIKPISSIQVFRIYDKMTFWPLCNGFLQISISSTSLFKDKLPLFQLVYVILHLQYFLFCSLVEIEFNCINVFFVVYLCILLYMSSFILFPNKYGSMASQQSILCCFFVHVSDEVRV